MMNGATLAEEQGGKKQELTLRAPEKDGITQFRLNASTSASQYQEWIGNLDVLFSK